jgi:hypothetical protein
MVKNFGSTFETNVKSTYEYVKICTQRYDGPKAGNFGYELLMGTRGLTTAHYRSSPTAHDTVGGE